MVDASFKDSSISACLSASRSSAIFCFPSVCILDFSGTIVATFLASLFLGPWLMLFLPRDSTGTARPRTGQFLEK